MKKSVRGTKTRSKLADAVKALGLCAHPEESRAPFGVAATTRGAVMDRLRPFPKDLCLECGAFIIHDSTEPSGEATVPPPLVVDVLRADLAARHADALADLDTEAMPPTDRHLSAEWTDRDRLRVLTALLPGIVEDLAGGRYGAAGRPNLTSLQHVIAEPAATMEEYRAIFESAVAAHARGERWEPPAASQNGGPEKVAVKPRIH